MRKTYSAGLVLALLGLGVLVFCSVPVTSTEQVVNACFTVPAGSKYGPNDPGTGYHTRIFGKSVLSGDVLVDGAGIYLTAGFFNTQQLNNVYVDRQYNFLIDPADDLYVFTFDNTKGLTDSFVRFTLNETWTRPVALGHPPLFVLGLLGLVMFPVGLLALILGMRKSVSPARQREVLH